MTSRLRSTVSFDDLPSTSPRSLAGATLSYLHGMPSSPSGALALAPTSACFVHGVDTSKDKSLVLDRGSARTGAVAVVVDKHTPPVTLPHQFTNNNGSYISPATIALSLSPKPTASQPVETPGTATGNSDCSVALPTLLRYVDNDLMRDKSLHDLPSDPNARCPVCFYTHNTAPVPSTFLPLTPCGCWTHYRCFVWWTTRAELDHDRCPVCMIKLFEWEGITVLTVATRTGFEPESLDFPPQAQYTDQLTDQFVTSDATEYISECANIELRIHNNFFRHLGYKSHFLDKSPDLIRCYYDILEEMDHEHRPTSRWLLWNNRTGFFLFGMLVALKMRRYLVEHHASIQGTEAWWDFENGRHILQRKILDEVHGGTKVANGQSTGLFGGTTHDLG